MSGSAAHTRGPGGGALGLVTTTLSQSLHPTRKGRTAIPTNGKGLPRPVPPSAHKKALTRLPRYVQACAANAWHVHTWKQSAVTGEISNEKRSPYRCHSWRHEGDCRRWRAAQNFARVSKALEPHRPQNVVMMVLTLDPAEWKDRWEAFAELSRCWSSLRKAITRAYGDNDWVGTVEVHRSGWPHMNVVMVSPQLGDAVAHDAKGTLEWLKRHAVSCGFGWRCSIEQASSKRAVAGYIVKVAGEIESAASPDADGRMVGEVVKLSQLPVESKRHFRRLRSSVKFLPPPFKNTDPEITGALVRQSAPPVLTHVVDERVLAEVTGTPLPPTPSHPPAPPVDKVALGELLTELRQKLAKVYERRRKHDTADAVTPYGEHALTDGETKLLLQYQQLAFEQNSERVDRELAAEARARMRVVTSAAAQRTLGFGAPSP